MQIPQKVMQGQYTLEIFDGAADGWGGTWLGLEAR